MEERKQTSIGSEYMACDLGITRRTANYLRSQEGFPPIMWVGRQWRVDRDAYEAWKIFCYQTKGGK